MKLQISFIMGLIISSLACKNNRRPDTYKNEIDIINSIFLKVVDTTSYHYEKYTSGYMQDSMSYIISYKEPTIAVYDKLDNIYEWKKNILAELARQSSQLKEIRFFKKLFTDNNNDTLQKQLAINDLPNVANFKLIPYTNKNVRKIKGTLSRLKFSRVLYDDKNGIALLVVTTQDNIKSGKVMVVFLGKRTGGWNIIAEPVVEIW